MYFFASLILFFFPRVRNSPWWMWTKEKFPMLKDGKLVSIYHIWNSLEMLGIIDIIEWIEQTHFIFISISLPLISSHRQLQSNGTLEFPAFSSQFYRSDIHDQVYRCQATNQAGSIISRNIHVRGIIHQYYDVKIDGTDVHLNNVAFLRCSVPAHLREFVEVTTWFRGEEALTENSDISK